MKFSEQLSILRKERGISQEALADMLAVSRQAISKWETGAALPELSNVDKLCAIFDVTPNELLGYEKKPEREAAPTESEGKVMPRWLQTVALVLISILFGLLLGMMFADGGGAGEAEQMPVLEIRRYELSPQGLVQPDYGEMYTRFRLTFYPEEVVDGAEYFVVVTTAQGGSKSYPASMENGVCSAYIQVSHRAESATVSILVNFEEKDLNCPLVRIFSLSDKSYLTENLLPGQENPA